jgi:hypothetical protein
MLPVKYSRLLFSAGFALFFGFAGSNLLAVGAALTVNSGGDFQSALDQAQPGDEIVLQAGASFNGPFTLPNKSGAGEIVVRSSASGSLADGVRVTPQDAGSMPKIVSPDSSSAIFTSAGAHGFRFIGIEFTPAESAFAYNVISISPAAGDWTDLNDVPHDITFDRCYIHGDAQVGARRGIVMNGANLQVLNSYFSNFMDREKDSQALAAWNGPGPFLIQNNHLEGAGENVMFGGQDPSIPNLVPGDIRILNNYFLKPLSWKTDDPSYAGTHWVVKNLLEFKNAQRVVVDGNEFQNIWPDGQNGFAILFTVRNQNGTAPWSVVQDVQFTNNVVHDIANGINILGWDNLAPSQQVRNITLQNNLFYNVGAWGNRGWLLQMLDGSANVVMDHNTAFETGAVLYATASTGSPHSGEPNSGFVFQNNVVTNGTLGVAGDGDGSGLAALADYFTSPVVRRNAFIAGVPALFPANNFFPGTTGDVGFVNPDGNDYTLSSSSPYRASATDGTALGLLRSSTNATGAAPLNPSPAPTTPGSPAGAPTSAVTRIEDNAAGVTYTGSWFANAGSRNSGSHAMLSMDSSASATISFNGTAVTLVTYNDEWSGIAAIYVDGALAGEADTYASPSRAQYASYTVSGLTSGQHTVSIAPTGRKSSSSGGAWVWIDAFDVTTAVTSSSSGSAPSTNQGTPLTFRVEQDGAGITYTGAWLLNTLASHSGGTAVLAVDAGARATFAFHGTGVSWIAYRDAWSGIARVYMDGALKGSIDTYSSADIAQSSMYTVSGLASGNHVLVIEVTSQKNTSSGGAWVWVDAFDVMSVPPPGGTPLTGTPQHIEQDNAAVKYSGTWALNTNTIFSGGSSRLSMDAGSTATFTFTGTDVAWLGYRDEYSGIADVYIDGTLQAEVDTYSSPATRAAMYTVSGLAWGMHTVVIEVVGRRNSSSSGNWVWLDGFNYNGAP